MLPQHKQHEKRALVPVLVKCPVLAITGWLQTFEMVSVKEFNELIFI